MNINGDGIRLSLAALSLAAIFSCSNISCAGAQDQKSRLPPQVIYEAMLKVAKEKGWVQFRNYAGKQWIYFTAIQTLHCRLKEIRYSVNSDALDKKFPIVACNPQAPFQFPPKTDPNDISVQVELGSAKTVAVQVVWEDGKETEVMVYEPCKDVGEQTCAWPVK